MPLIVPYIVPPTRKSLFIPTPPDTTNAPVDVDDEFSVDGTVVVLDAPLPPIVTFPVDVLNKPELPEKSMAPVVPLVTVIFVDGVVPEPIVIVDAFPPNVIGELLPPNVTNELPPPIVTFPVDVLNVPELFEKSIAPVVPLATDIFVDGVVPEPIIIFDAFPPIVTAPVDVLNAPELPEKSIAPEPLANTALVAPEKVAVPVMPTALGPIVTAPVDVLNAPELPEKSILLEPEATTPPPNIKLPFKNADPLATYNAYELVSVPVVVGAPAI